MRLLMPSRPPRLAGVELGGTNAVLVLGEGMRIVERVTLPVGGADDTLAAVREQLQRWAPRALGIASFGPICVDPTAANYGTMLATPKPGWSGARVRDTLAPAVDGPAALHTDVTAAALAEGRFGAAQGCRDFVYMTIGTGIGLGIIANGAPVVGRLHPEGGHISVRRVGGDAFAGVCPFHGDCLEGLASGPAIAARYGGDAALLGDDDPCWDPVVDALAEACATLLLILSSQKIILGGGVAMGRQWLPARVARAVGTKLANYPGPLAPGALCVAALGTNAGPTGALMLAENSFQASFSNR
jgi:fructokinase